MKRSSDSNRSRRQSLPVWEKLSSIIWNDTKYPDLKRVKATKTPSDDSLASGSLGYLTSFMATRQIVDVDEGEKQFAEFRRRHFRHLFRKSGLSYRQQVAAKVKDKGRLFGTMDNTSDLGGNEKTCVKRYDKESNGE